MFLLRPISIANSNDGRNTHSSYSLGRMFIILLYSAVVPSLGHDTLMFQREHFNKSLYN